MIKKVFYILICLFILGVPPMYGATRIEVEQVFEEAKPMCLAAMRRCTFRTIEFNAPVAYTQYGEITVSSGIYNIMNREEVRGIVFHEVAHAVLRHSEKAQSFYNEFVMINKRPPTSKDITEFRHNGENQADAMAVLMLYVGRYPITLDSALAKIVLKYNNGDNCNSHPSAAYRIQHINNIKQKLGVN